MFQLKIDEFFETFHFFRQESACEHPIDGVIISNDSLILLINCYLTSFMTDEGDKKPEVNLVRSVNSRSMLCRLRTLISKFDSSQILRRTDQLLIGGILAAMFVSVSIWWAGSNHGTIEIDQAPPQTVQFQVDLNRAEPIELMQIPGIGTTLAERIVDSRSAEGRYNQRKDVQRVKGIGPKTYDQIEKYLLPLEGDGIVAGTP